MSLFNELKRRNVFRVAAAYLVISWLLVQVLGLAASSFEAPTWVMKMIITLLAIGFIPTILFSWAYELTPEGLKKDSEVDPEKSNSSQTANKLNTITLLAVISAGGMFAYQQMNPTIITDKPSGQDTEIEVANSDSRLDGNEKNVRAKEETSEKIEEMDMNFKLIAKERENEYQTRLYFLETQKSTILWVLAFLLIAGILTLYRQLLKLKAKNEVLFKLGLKEKSLIEKKKETDDSYSELISAFECLMIDKRIFEKSNLTIDSVSKKLGTNRTYLSEAINAHYNVSYSRWVNELRIQESKKYLASKEHDCYCIDGISKMVGFSSISAFNSNFKSITGLTPSYYRKRSVSS